MDQANAIIPPWEVVSARLAEVEMERRWLLKQLRLSTNLAIDKDRFRKAREQNKARPLEAASC